MKLTFGNAYKYAAGFALVASAGFANANLVNNGNFSAGEAGWDPLGSVTFNGDAARSASLGAQFKSSATDNNSGSLTKSIDLNSSSIYKLKFFVKSQRNSLSFNFGNYSFNNFGSADVDQGLNFIYEPEEYIGAVDSNGDPIFDSNGDPIDIPDVNDWWSYTATVTGLGDNSLLAFSFSGAAGFTTFLDDVSLDCTGNCTPTNGGGNNGVPEPGSLLLVGAALAGLGLVRRRKAA